jgi:hypothetical protein
MKIKQSKRITKTLPQSIILELVELSYTIMPIPKQQLFLIGPYERDYLKITHSIPGTPYWQEITHPFPEKIDTLFRVKVLHFQGTIYVLFGDELLHK